MIKGLKSDDFSPFYTSNNVYARREIVVYRSDLWYVVMKNGILS